MWQQSQLAWVWIPAPSHDPTARLWVSVLNTHCLSFLISKIGVVRGLTLNLDPHPTQSKLQVTVCFCLHLCARHFNPHIHTGTQGRSDFSEATCPGNKRIEIWIPGLPSFSDKERKLSPRNQEMEKINKKIIQGWGNKLDFGTREKDYWMAFQWDAGVIALSDSMRALCLPLPFELFCCRLVAQLCLTLCNPLDYSPPGSSIHEIFQARILEWVATPFSRGPSQPKEQTNILRLLRYRWILYH